MVLPGHRASIMSLHDDNSCSPEDMPSFYDPGAINLHQDPRSQELTVLSLARIPSRLSRCKCTLLPRTNRPIRTPDPSQSPRQLIPAESRIEPSLARIRPRIPIHQQFNSPARPRNQRTILQQLPRIFSTRSPKHVLHIRLR